MRIGTAALAGAALGAAGLAAYATLVEPRWLETTHTRIHLRRLPSELEGLRIALLSDFHAGGALSLRRAEEAARRAMAERPDLVALTGDFVSTDPAVYPRVFDALSGLEAPLGVYAVPGNHDYVAGIRHWRDEVERRPGIVDLTNRGLLMDVGSARLCLAGVDDFYEGRPRLDFLPPPDARDLTLLLAHGPDQAEWLRRGDDAVDLVLSGHTHGGQVRLPFLGAPINSAKNPDLYEEGLRRRPWTQVYTTRGIGTAHLPVRFGARPEVAILELTRAPRPRRQEG